MKLLIIGFIIFQCLSSYAESLGDVKTDLGSGAEYDVEMAAGNAKVSIYFVKPPAENKKAVEMFFQAKGWVMPIQLWQQFHLKLKKAKLEVENGYIYSDQFQTRVLDKDYLQGFDGVQMNQFLISSQENLKKHFVANETVKVPAGTVEASHYRIENAGQTVDFWIHHQSKPIGMIKIISKGLSAKQNYSMSLTQLISGVGRKIDPTKAIEMDDTVRAFLPKPNSSTLKGLGLF